MTSGAPADEPEEARPCPDLASLYIELRARAERFMTGQPKGHTLQATALVHEACLKLFGHDSMASIDRGRYLALASAAMRSVLVDHARAKGRNKRLPPAQRIPIEELQLAFEERGGDLLALDAALEKLRGFDPLMGQAIDLHFFGGLSFEHTAAALGIPLRSLERRWQGTRTWLRAELKP